MSRYILLVLASGTYDTFSGKWLDTCSTAVSTKAFQKNEESNRVPRGLPSSENVYPILDGLLVPGRATRSRVLIWRVNFKNAYPPNS